MRMTLVTCCESAIVDLQSNKISFINLIDGGDFAQFPAVYSHIAFVCLFERDEGDDDEFTAVARFSMDEDRLFNGTFSATFQGGDHTRVIGQMDQLVVPRPGRVTCSVFRGDQKLGSWHFDVEKSEDEGFQLVSQS